MQNAKDLKFELGGMAFYNQGCGQCGGGYWNHPNDKCKKFVNSRENWEAAKAASGFDLRQAGTRTGKPPT